VAVLTEAQSDVLTLRAAIFSPDGMHRADAEATFAATDPGGPARLAAELLARASPAITAYFTGSHEAQS
jgi:hydroxymethylbilane synthase